MRDENDELLQRVDKYAYDDDPKYMSGLPTIINGWVERQLTEKSSPWDKDKMDEEFAKAKHSITHRMLRKDSSLWLFA